MIHSHVLLDPTWTRTALEGEHISPPHAFPAIQLWLPNVFPRNGQLLNQAVQGVAGDCGQPLISRRFAYFSWK